VGIILAHIHVRIVFFFCFVSAVGWLTFFYRFCTVVPVKLAFTEKIKNPAIPHQVGSQKPSRYRPPGLTDVVTESLGKGAKRIYLDIQSQPPNVAYPPRPVSGSVADMDHIMKHCDFGQTKVWSSASSFDF
jgi:hypothetical protein